jgi:hypothetical protein
MTTNKNLCGKCRKVNAPYEVWRAGSWEWRVLKKYKSPESEAKDPFARWFCAVKSPMTFGTYDMGDVYVSELKGRAVKVENPVIEQW